MIHASLENNDLNEGSALTLYFREKPSEEQVRAACAYVQGSMQLGTDLNDPHWEFVVAPTPVSEAAKMVRVQVFPTC